MVDKASRVPDAFQKFKSALQPDSKPIINRHEYIRNTFSNKITNDGREHSFLSGSYARDTLINPVNDVDIVIIFDRDTYFEEYKSNPKELLNLTFEKLCETYPEKKETGDIMIQSHSIGIKFKSIPDVDIIPGFIFNFDEKIYQIPNYELNDFIKTSPKLHSEILTEHNKLLNDKFKPIIKMVKCWRNKLRSESVEKYGIELKIKSFHLEVLLMNILTKPFQNYPSGLFTAFEGLSEFIIKECEDPAKFSGDLGFYLSELEKLKIKEICDEIKSEILNLINLQNDGDHEEAIRGWGKIFGSLFPRPLIQKNVKKNEDSTNFPKKDRNEPYGFGER